MEFKNVPEGGEVIASFKLPGEDYLWAVLVDWGGGEYGVLTCNTQIWEYSCASYSNDDPSVIVCLIDGVEMGKIIVKR